MPHAGAKGGLDRLSGLVAGHVLLARLALAVLAFTGAWVTDQGVRHRLEQERLDSLNLNAQRRGIELMSQTLNGNQMGAIGLLGLIDAGAKLEALNAKPPNGSEAAQLMESIARAHLSGGTWRR